MSWVEYGGMIRSCEHAYHLSSMLGLISFYQTGRPGCRWCNPRFPFIEILCFDIYDHHDAFVLLC